MSAVTLLFARLSAPLSRPRVTRPSTTTCISTRDELDVLLIHEGMTDEAMLRATLDGQPRVTTFARCHSVGTLPTPPIARPTRGLLVGVTDCGDASRLGEFHDFYDRVHAREVVDSGLYWRCRRLERDVEDVSTPRFFALYDTEGDEPETYRQLRTRRMTTDWPASFLVRSVATYRIV